MIFDFTDTLKRFGLAPDAQAAIIAELRSTRSSQRALAALNGQVHALHARILTYKQQLQRQALHLPVA